MAPTRYWLGLGANLGDRIAALQGALERLGHEGVVVDAVSPLYETAPRDLPDQPPFLNAAARVHAPHDPLALLAAVKRIERCFGRGEGGPRYGPRPLDIDLLLWEGGVHRSPELEIPHPRLAERRFALVPVLDLDPDAALPDGRRLSALEAALDARVQSVTPVPGRLEGGRRALS